MVEDNQADKAPITENDATEFFSREEAMLETIAAGLPFTFRRGNGWAILPETGEATYDPKFFTDRGYTPAQSLFAAMHELRCHLVETAHILSSSEGKTAWQRHKNDSKKERWVHIWDNCRTDAKGNQAILSFAPVLTEETQDLYRQKLFPESDLTELPVDKDQPEVKHKTPRHLQFIYAVLRRAMLPGEETVVSEEVETAISGLTDFNGNNVLAMVTDPGIDPTLSLQLSKQLVEPVIKALYEQDLEEKKSKKGAETKTDAGQGEGEPDDGQKSDGAPNQDDEGNEDKNEDADKSSKNGDEDDEPNPFEKEYEDYERRHPDPFDEENEDEIDKKIIQTIENQSETARQARAYAEKYGVSQKDVANYREEYRKITPYLEEMRQIFEQIVEERQIPMRKLRKLSEEGVMPDPGLIAQTFIDLNAGVPNPKTMRDFEGQMVPQNFPGKFALRLVADLSGSMQGEKAVHQRRAAILVMEALNELQDRLLDGQPLGVPLEIFSELRAFGVVGPGNSTITKLFKPLSVELSERERIDYFNGLLSIGGGTNDYDSLAEIDRDIDEKIKNDPLYGAELKSGRRREIVIVLSDGDSNRDKVQEVTVKLREKGVKVVGLGMSASASGIEDTYLPDGQICADTSQVPERLKEMFKGFLGELLLH